jgi:hypothetical protein
VKYGYGRYNKKEAEKYSVVAGVSAAKHEMKERYRKTDNEQRRSNKDGWRAWRHVYVSRTPRLDNST